MNRFHTIVASVVCAGAVVMHAQAGFAGKWQGATQMGRQVGLDLEVKGQQLTGRLTLDQQSADITEGKVEEKTFSFKATIDDRTVTFSGELAGEDLVLTPQGAGRPVTLKRVK
jgi:hypothetical protein